MLEFMLFNCELGKFDYTKPMNYESTLNYY